MVGQESAWATISAVRKRPHVKEGANEKLLEAREANEKTSMEVGIFTEEDISAEEECETIEDTEESQGLVDVEEIDVEIEKYKKSSSQEFQGADGKIYANCDNCGKTLTKDQR